MEKTAIMDFTEFCKEQIREKLNDFVGSSYYMSELGWDITQGMNCDGTFTYSTELAKDYLREWWWEASDYWDYEKFNFGENQSNPFDNPEVYIVRMVIEGVNSLLSQCDAVGENWDDKVELTQEMADSICEQLDDLEIDWLND